MTNQDRKRAFAMRLEGKTWEEIGETLCFHAETVRNDMQTCIWGEPRRVRSVYPALRDFIEERCGGNVREFAQACGISPNVMYRVLPGQRLMTMEEAQAIREVTGLTVEEIMRKDDY